MDDFTLALIIIGDMTITERKLRAQIAALEQEAEDKPDEEDDARCD